jgi:hypothetical protein
MTEDAFIRVRNTLSAVAQVATSPAVSDAELAEFIADCERSSTLAPFLDPTAFMRGGDALRRMTNHARAWQTFRASIGEVNDAS